MTVVDFLGQEVNVGDFVFFTKTSYSKSYVIRVDRFSKTGKPIGVVVKPKFTRDVSEHPRGDFIKIPNEAAIIWKLSQ